MGDNSTEQAKDSTTTATAGSTENKTPVFGQASTFGTAGFGFSGLKDVSKVDESNKNEEEAGDPEEECSADYKPIVQVQEVQAVSGEEGETTWLDYKCKLYRIDAGEWKERGTGQVKILESSEKKVRLLMRQDKTLKIRANHYLIPGTELQQHSGNDKSWVWRTVDYSDGEEKVEMLCIRFGSEEKAAEFKKQFYKGMEQNQEAGLGDATKTDTDVAAPQKAQDEAVDELAQQINESVTVTKEDVKDDE